MTHADDEELRPVLQDDEDEAAAGGEPDVLLDVSQLSVDEITLEVEDLRARVALQADVLKLLNLHVGVDVGLGRVKLTIKGVEAKLLLKVRLDNVARIIDRVLATIDDNPDIGERLLEAVPETVEEVDGLTGEVGRGVADVVEDVTEGAGEAVGDVAGEARTEPLTEDAPERRRRRGVDSTRTRRAKGSRTSRGRRSEEG